MGCVQSYFKRENEKKSMCKTHNAGVSPSSTQESNSKQPGSEDGGRAVQEERSITEEPESNDTSYGVEATAVRTLAATTGTVAILGTTAKTGDKEKREEGDSTTPTPTVVETIPEEQEEPAVSVEKAVVHGEEKVEVHGEEGKEGERSKPASRPVSSVEESGKKEEESIEEKVSSPPLSSNEKESLPSQSPAVAKSPSEPNKTETTAEIKSPILPLEGIEPKNAEENASELVVSELIKEDDFSKSISSERLKTNSISNTTLSSDSIAEIENNSVKQSPSGDKVVESFDSSSTVEFVDIPTKDASKGEGQQEDLRTNPARSISSDLSNRISLPVDGEKTPDALSPLETIDDMPPPPPLEPEELEATISNDVSGTPTNLNKEETASSSKNKASPEVEKEENTNSSLKDVLNDESSLNSEISSNTVISVVKNDTVEEVNSKSIEDNDSPNASEDNNKAETGSPFSSGNNSSFSGNGETASPVTAVTLNPAPTSPESVKEEIKQEKSGSAASKRSETTPELTNGISSKPETPSNALVEKSPSPNVEKISKTTVVESNTLESLTSKPTETKINGEVSDDVFGSPIDLTDEKVVAAATTIQASFRGFQTRQTMKAGEKEIEDRKQTVEVLESEAKKSIDAVKESSVNSVSENSISKKSDMDDQKQTIESLESEIKKSIEAVEETPLNSVSEGFDSTTEQPDSILEDVDDKMIAAATTIQANFRGFQTRQTLKSKLDSGFPTSEETTQSVERKTPTTLTPELIESVKEEVDDICKEAEIIAAERSESAEGMMKGVDQVVVETRKAGLPSVSESVKAVRGSASPPSVSEDAEDPKEEVFDPLMLDVDEKTIQAATTIQASFRGFQTRKNLQGQNLDQPDSMPDFPPPVAEDEYLQSLEDLPPPDFEALESSYSEDVPTEPLAPPPPLDQDSIIFNEEDEDELMALQRPAECDELPEHRPTLDTDSSLSESSLSSAATKIQAGVRGHLARKQIQAQVQSGTGTGTSTSTNLLDSDQSLSVSREEEGGVRSAISTEEESEIARHNSSPPVAPDRPSRSATKRMSLGSALTELPPARSRAPLRSAMSVQGPAPVSDDEVWDTLKGEMSEAATTIQSNFRGYRARKQLQREDAVQVTSGSSQATPSSGSVEAGRSSGASGAEPRGAEARSSGEYHDMIALTPPSVKAEGGDAAVAQSVAGQTAEPDGEMVKRRADGEVREAAAATKIQATFRGFKSRQEMKEVDLAAAKIQAGFRGYKVRKEMKKKNGIRRSSNPEQGDKSGRVRQSGNVEESAATKIQAGVRGFLVRRRNQKEQDAATKIQAGFRGFQTRKQADHD